VQPYTISLELTVPLAPYNMELGNFMAGIEIRNKNDSTLLIASRRPCLLPKPWLAFLYRSQTVIIKLIENIELPISTTTARIEIGRRDGWRSLRNHIRQELTVKGVYLRGDIVPSGIWGWVVKYPISMSILSSLAFLVVSTLGLCIGIIPYGESKSAIVQG